MVDGLELSFFSGVSKTSKTLGVVNEISGIDVGIYT